MPFLSENLEKKIFYSLAAILFILMPLMSLKSGISGDEETYHYPHGKNVYNYYATLGKDTTCLYYDNSVLHMYGPVFDVITVVFIKILKPEDEYMVRHILNSLTGWAALFFAGLIAVMLGGWRTGIFTMLLMFLSPRFLGHSFNNPKDIPFAAAYIFTIYAIIRFLRAFPENKYRYAWPVALGIGLSIGVRVGGILLIVYFLFFAGLLYMFGTDYKNWLNKTHLRKLGRILLYVAIISVAGYMIGIALWPYAHKSPLSNTFQALSYMEQYGTSLRQVFEGKTIWSDNAPTGYLPKYIFMTIPALVILGLICFIVLSGKLKKQDTLWYLILIFVSVFPVIYIIYKKSNVYGGWRHISFIYPGLVILSATGINTVFSVFKQKYIRYGIIAFLMFLSFFPVKHYIKNHPHEYIYYNCLSGGVKKAYGEYEMDYFYHSLRAGSEWLIRNKLNFSEISEDNPVRIASNFSTNVKYYFRNYPEKAKIYYIRYYERGNSDWDYAIIANSYINPFQLQRNIWPPANTIHTIDVDGKPICAILERKSKDDYTGYQLLSSGNSEAAIPFFQAALREDNKYEMEYYNLAQAYLNTGDYDKAIEASVNCLRYYPNYDRCMNLLGMAYLNKGEYEQALQVFLKNMESNPKYVASYYYAGVVYAQNNNLSTALKYLNEAITINRNYKPAYLLAARIHQSQGNEDMARRLTEIANQLP